MIKGFVLRKLIGVFIRHAMTMAGGYVVLDGHTDPATWVDIMGGVTAAAGLLLSAAEKRSKMAL